MLQSLSLGFFQMRLFTPFFLLTSHSFLFASHPLPFFFLFFSLSYFSPHPKCILLLYFWSWGNEAMNWDGWNRGTGGRDRHRLSVRCIPPSPCRLSWLNSRLTERRAIFKWEPKVVLGISRVSACKCCSGAPSFVWASSYGGFDRLPISSQGLGGWVEMGAWKAALKRGLSQLLGCEPLDYLILERKERKECFADSGHTPYVVTCERKQQPIHFNTHMPLESYLYDQNHGIGSQKLQCTSAAIRRSCSSGKNWKDRVSWSCRWGRAWPTESRTHEKLLVSSEESELLSSSRVFFLVSSTNTVISTYYNDYFLLQYWLTESLLLVHEVVNMQILRRPPLCARLLEYFNRFSALQLAWF